MASFPTVFLSHGSPTLALNPGPTGDAWAALARDLPRPKAILMVSAHWETAEPEVGAVDRPETIHDFYGFPEPLYQLRYPAPGAPWLAERVRGLLGDAGICPVIDQRRGIDHGAWVPLLSMYPAADLPVVQLSVQTRLGTRHHIQIGRALNRLPAEDVLVIGSGSATHNLREVMWGVEDPARVPAYVTGFQEWLLDTLQRTASPATASDAGEELCDYRTRAPEAARAHPTEEHFLPLFTALGAAGPLPRVERLIAGVTEGVLGMDVYTFWPAA